MSRQAYTPKPEEVHASNLRLLKDRIKSGDVSGAYLFYGDEEYLKRHYYSLLLEKVGDRQLNSVSIYEDDFSYSEFINACDTSPAMFDLFSADSSESDTESSYRLVRLVNPKFENLSNNDEEKFLERISEAIPGVIIVLWLYSGEQDKLSKDIYKAYSEKALVVNFVHEPAASQSLISWIIRHFTKAGLQIERNVAFYLNNSVGNDMTTLKDEIEKCINYLHYENRETLTVEDVDFICRKSITAQIFDISSNALKGNYVQAMSALGVFRQSGEKALLVFGTISKAITDMCNTDRLSREGLGVPEIVRKTGMRDFVVKNYKTLLSARAGSFGSSKSFCEIAGDLCLKYDILLKSSRTDGYELLEELIFKLCFN